MKTLLLIILLAVVWIGLVWFLKRWVSSGKRTETDLLVEAFKRLQSISVRKQSRSQTGDASCSTKQKQ
jgi:hypothetical protein